MPESKTPQSPKTVTGLPVNTEAAACYILGWITGLVFLILEKDNKKIRFHALQSIVLFGAMNLIYWIFSIVTLGLGLILMPLLGILSFILWLVIIYKTYQGEDMKIPFVTDFVKAQLK